MLEKIKELAEYLDNLTGIKGTLGHILIVIGVMAAHMWSSMGPSSHATGPKQVEDDEEEEPEPPRNFTLEQLAYFNGQPDGKDHRPVYLSLNGTVFDVSQGRNFYGPDGPYEAFAGHECGMALAKMSFDTEFLDNIEGCETELNPGERMELDNWMEKFQYYRCYPIKGKVIPDRHLPSSTRTLTREELAQYTGTQEVPKGFGAPPIYVGAGGKVFDVSFGGVTFYGPGCSYHLFAGKDASRALAKMSFDAEHIENSDTSDLTEKEKKVLADWIKTFEERKRYPIVGVLAKS